MFRVITLIITISWVLFLCSVSPADTVILKSGKKVKGLILDEFKDRIVLSTADGEKTIIKSDIRSAVYDSEEKALMRMGENQLKRGQYIKAYHTFEKVVELDPDLEKARERRNYLRSYLETKTRYDVVDDLNTRKERYEGAEGKIPVREVEEELGLVLAPGDKYVSIESIRGRGRSRSGPSLAPGDRIVAVWGELTAYMGVDEVAELLLAPGEVKFTVERDVHPGLSSAGKLSGVFLRTRYKRIAGAELKLKTEGVIVENIIPGGPFETAGIRKGDLVYRISGRNTRYMPMAELVKIIEENQNRKIDLVIRRDITLWRKEQDI